MAFGSSIFPSSDHGDVSVDDRLAVARFHGTSFQVKRPVVVDTLGKVWIEDVSASVLGRRLVPCGLVDVAHLERAERLRESILKADKGIDARFPASFEANDSAPLIRDELGEMGWRLRSLVTHGFPVVGRLGIGNADKLFDALIQVEERAINGRSGIDLGRRRLVLLFVWLDFIADRHTMAGTKQSVQVDFERMVRKACHGSGPTSRQGDLEALGHSHGVLVESFVEVAGTKEKDHARMTGLGVVVLVKIAHGEILVLLGPANPCRVVAASCEQSNMQDQEGIVKRGG